MSSTTADTASHTDPPSDPTLVRHVIGGAAAAAFGGWSQTPAHVRARVLFRFRDLVERDADRLARILTREHGKVLSDARGEPARGLEVVEFACGIPQQLKGEFSEDVGRGIDAELALLLTEAGAPTGCSTSGTATGWPSTPFSATTGWRRSASSAPPPSPSTSTAWRTTTASASRPSGAPRTTWSSCPTPTWTRPSTP